MQISPQTISTIVAVGVALLIITLRMRRLSQGRRLRLELMWIFPSLLLAITVAMLIGQPPRAGDWPWIAGIALIGGVVGFYRGRMMQITVDPETHALNQQASPAALIFILAIFAVRYLLRSLLNAESSALGISAALLTDGFVVFAAVMFSVTRIEMAIRAMRMLKDAKAAKAAATAAP